MSLHELGEAYIGSNKAHQRFVQKLTNEKVFMFVFMKNKENLFSSFQSEIEAGRKRAGSNKFSIAVVTKGISKTQFKGIMIRYNENLMAKSSDEFQSQVFVKVYSEVHRIFVDYTIDLYDEISEGNPEIPKINNMSYREPRIEAFKKIDLSILPPHGLEDSTKEVLLKRMNILEVTRNVIEHNDSIVDKKYLKYVKDNQYKIGDKIVIEPEQIGEAMALVESVAGDLNKRALIKFKYLTEAGPR